MAASIALPAVMRNCLTEATEIHKISPDSTVLYTTISAQLGAALSVRADGKLTVLFRTEFREMLIHVSRADFAWQCIFRLLSSSVIEAPLYLKTRINLSNFVFAAVTS
jgi:hypothetical protein